MKKKEEIVEITTADLVYERDTTISERIGEALAGAAESGMTFVEIETALPSNRPSAIRNALCTMTRGGLIVRMRRYRKNSPSTAEIVYFLQGFCPA